MTSRTLGPVIVMLAGGWALGAMLYPVERALVRRRRESPSTELMVCRKTQRREDAKSQRGT